MRRMPICERLIPRSVVVAIPEGTAQLQGSPSPGDPGRSAKQAHTATADVATTGNSGSAFDGGNLCPLGIVSRKISVIQGAGKIGYRSPRQDISAPIVKSSFPGVTY